MNCFCAWPLVPSALQGPPARCSTAPVLPLLPGTTAANRSLPCRDRGCPAGNSVGGGETLAGSTAGQPHHARRFERERERRQYVRPSAVTISGSRATHRPALGAYRHDASMQHILDLHMSLLTTPPGGFSRGYWQLESYRPIVSSKQPYISVPLMALI